jgi:hypothetical protein
VIRSRRRRLRVGLFHEIEAFEPEGRIHGVVAGGLGTGDCRKQDVAGFLDEFFEQTGEDVGVNGVARGGDWQSGAALGVVAQGVNHCAEVGGGQLDAEGNGGLAVVFDDGGEALDDAAGLAFAVFDVLLRGCGHDGRIDFQFEEWAHGGGDFFLRIEAEFAFRFVVHVVCRIEMDAVRTCK